MQAAGEIQLLCLLVLGLLIVKSYLVLNCEQLFHVVRNTFQANMVTYNKIPSQFISITCPYDVYNTGLVNLDYVYMSSTFNNYVINCFVKYLFLQII